MNKRLKPWRNDVAVAGRAAMGGRPPFHEAVSLRAVFVFGRPATHYRTGRFAGEVKPGAPGWKKTTPDLDKLVRALGDALSGVVIRDDRQIVDLAVTKIWGQNPGVTVEVRTL
jgi:Holliday junction resolvase RusA-like endonuclease